MTIMKIASMKSMTIMSFENLVTILPIGFESKKRILALSTALHAALCILVEDVLISQKQLRALSKLNKKKSAIEMTNIIG